MKTDYRGHEIEAYRGDSMAGIDLLYFSVFRESDGYECTSGFTYGGETPAEFTKHLKSRIDAELATDDPWGERGSTTLSEG